MFNIRRCLLKLYNLLTERKGALIMLNLLLGRSGSGKSHYLRKISEEYINSGKPVLVLVPEQFSFETGLYFLDKNSKASSENVKVLSFSSMVKYVFSQVGGLTNSFLDEGTSKILMSIALEICCDNLNLYERQSKNKNFVDTLLNTINEYKSNGITPDDLLSVKATVDNPTLKQKLEETALILNTYNALVSENYVHNQDVLSYLADSIRENKIFNGYTVFIDAFTGFTGQQYKVLEAIMAQVQDVYITLCTECRENKVDESSIRFRVTIDTYHKLRALAKKCSLQINEIYKPFVDNRRTQNEDLKAVEKALYAFPTEVYGGKVDNVSIYSATDVYSECEYVATRIKQLTVNEGYRYKDIAVVCRDEEIYRGILDVTFDKFNIGYFMDKPENINSKPLVNFIKHTFNAINNGFNSESILRLLKTGITKYSYDDISVMENYIFTWSPKWNEPFNQNVNGFGAGEMTESDKESLDRIENIRSEVYSYLKNFRENIQNKNGYEISKQISKLIDDFDVKETIQNKIQLLTSKNTPELVDEYTRVWNSVVSVISKMSKVLENIYMSGKRYYELFSLAINCEQIANQPLCIDRVIVGTAGRARLNSPKITFIIGAVQGIFPAVPSSGGVFTDDERKLLLSLGLPISCGLSDLTAQEQYSAYASLSSPSDRLYVSYYTNTVGGGGALPSTIVTQLQRILTNVKTSYQCNIYDLDPETLWCKQQAFEHTVSNMKNDDVNQKVLEDYFSSQEKYSTLLESIHSYKKKNPPQINKDTAHMLYSENMRLSASKLEDFYSCGYMYFCKNGLKLKERRKAKIDNREYGSIVHYVMEKFLKQENLEDIIEYTENYNINEIVKNITNDYINTYFDSSVIPDNKTQYTLIRAEKNCVVLVKRLIEELKVSSFRPADFELSIGINPDENSETQNVIDEYKIKTKDGEVSLIGYVDRVDLYKNPADGKTYVRIVDYKTGKKELKRCALEMGLSLQMFVYLSAILKNGSNLYGDNLAPAGVCYMTAKEFSTIVSQSGNTQENIKQIKTDFDKHYKASGLFVRDTDVIMAMDKNAEGKFIPVKMKIKQKKKKGCEPVTEVTFTRSDQYLLDGNQYEGEFKGVFDLVDNKICQMSDMLLDGYINSVPTGEKNEISELPCRYCKYKNSCNFTLGMPVNLIPSGRDKKEESNNG